MGFSKFFRLIRRNFLSACSASIWTVYRDKTKRRLLHHCHYPVGKLGPLVNLWVDVSMPYRACGWEAQNFLMFFLSIAFFYPCNAYMKHRPLVYLL